MKTTHETQAYEVPLYNVHYEHHKHGLRNTYVVRHKASCMCPIKRVPYGVATALAAYLNDKELPPEAQVLAAYLLDQEGWPEVLERWERSNRHR